MRTVSREVIEYAMIGASIDLETLREDHWRFGIDSPCFAITVDSFGDLFKLFVQLGIIGAQNEEDTSIEDSDYFDTGAAELLATAARVETFNLSSNVYFEGWVWE